MTDKEPTLEEMSEQISELETQLTEMRKAFRERKFSGLRTAMEARKSAEQAIGEELKSLGYGKLPNLIRSGSVWW